MKLVDTQDIFETLWHADPASKSPEGLRVKDRMFLVYFTATWCGHCKKINLKEVDMVAKKHGLTLWKVEHTTNDYTAGFCNVRSFPTFMAFQPKKVVGTFQSNVTEDICKWIESLN
jgi:thioredoxin-like negative regulator of GroEL